MSHGGDGRKCSSHHRFHYEDSIVVDGSIRIPDEALQELELDVGDTVYLIEEFVGNTRCLVLSKKPQIADRIDELTEAWDSGQRATSSINEAASMRFLEVVMVGTTTE